MIIELVSSTCFNSILYKEPLTIDEFKPYLYQTIRNMIKSDEVEDNSKKSKKSKQLYKI